MKDLSKKERKKKQHMNEREHATDTKKFHVTYY